MSYGESVFRKKLDEIDPEIAQLITVEEARQAEKIILIPSESICPAPVLEALGSAFSSIYGEGYTPSMMEGEDEAALTDMDLQLTRYRRYGDRRFYKGCEYANVVEAVAKRRAALLFATEENPAENISVNVQALSGSIANTVVYDAFVEPGDTVMGMSLMHGGHLTHGSEFNRSGKSYRIVSYEVDGKTGRLDYDSIRELAGRHRPKLIIAGYTSYPWAPDWKRFREIADSVDAILLADISHPAGLVVAGVYPHPIDYADVTVCTTHKTLFGPRGAIILTTNAEYGERIDQTVFPGEQGGPHLNKFAAMAVAFKIATSEEFREVQRRTVENARHLAEVLQGHGLKLAYGGTDTHLLLVDLNSVDTKSGYPLKGEIAVRILDLCGIVANKNTIPGDLVTAEASGIRLGTPWITQRGITDDGIEELGDIIATVLRSIRPFHYLGLTGSLPRGKAELELLTALRRRACALAEGLVSEKRARELGYPHESLLTPGIRGGEGGYKEAVAVAGEAPVTGETAVVEVSGTRAALFLDCAATQSISTMKPGESRAACLLDGSGTLLSPVVIRRTESPADGSGNDRFVLLCGAEDQERVVGWLRGLSDGYVLFDEDDVFRKVDGPVVIRSFGDPGVSVGGTARKEGEEALRTLNIPETARSGGKGDVESLVGSYPELFDLTKPYFIGQGRIDYSKTGADKRVFSYESEASPLKRSVLYEEHTKLGASMVPFAGWEMPVRYGSSIEEHRAVRDAAGLFDISHMGVFEVAGEHATRFLDTVYSNYVPWIGTGDSQYGYLLDVDGNVIDDIMIYRREEERYLVVVNAANHDVDLAWLQAINRGDVVIDRSAPLKEAASPAVLRDLKGAGVHENEALVDTALQGPRSRAILSELLRGDRERHRLYRLEKTRFMETHLDRTEVLIARTGYTGEDLGYELFVHPKDAAGLWNLLLDAGKKFGLLPVGLGARDSLRIEAGLPLHGNELAGPLEISPIEAGFGPYVKFHKAFFIGRDALLSRMSGSRMVVARFGMPARGTRIVKTGDPVISSRTQQMIGRVTSSAVDGESMQIGMAYVESRFAREDVKIGIVPLSSGGRVPMKSAGELEAGDRFSLPVEAVILSRFPERGRSAPL
jgi:glycine hydroxymethyltransferase